MHPYNQNLPEQVPTKNRFFRRVKDLLFVNRSTKQTIVKNVFWLSFSQIFGRIFRAGILIYAARVLGSEGYGVFSYALGLAGFFTAFADIGVSSIVTREAARQPEKRSEYFSTAFLIKLVLLTLTVGAIVFITPHFSNVVGAAVLIPIVAFLTFLDGIRDFSLSYFRAQEKMEWEAVVTLILNISIAIFGFIVLRISPTPKALTYAYVFSAGMGAFSAVFLLRKEFAKLISNFRKTLLKPILISALPIAVSGFFGMFMLNTDYVILGWMRGAAEIGFYAAAQKIVQVFYVLPGLVATGIFPSTSRLIGEKKHGNVKSINEQAIVLMLLIAMPLAVGGIILAGPIIALLYGAEYMPATLAFQLLVATTPFVFIGTILGNLLFAYDQQKKTAIYVGVAAVANVLLDLLLIPLFGIYGSSAGTLAVQFIYLFFMYRLISSINRLTIVSKLKKVILATITMGTVSFFLNLAGLHVLLNIAASILIYFAFLLVLKEVTLNELKKIVQRFK